MAVNDLRKTSLLTVVDPVVIVWTVIPKKEVNSVAPHEVVAEGVKVDHGSLGIYCWAETV